MEGKEFTYLQQRKFEGVSLRLVRLKSNTPLRIYSWSGIHPGFHYATHTITISEELYPVFKNATHEIKVAVKISGTPEERLIYQDQVNLDLGVRLSRNKVAEQLCCALVLYLLQTKDPRSNPGLFKVSPSFVHSPWSLVIKQTLRTIYQSSVEPELIPAKK